MKRSPIDVSVIIVCYNTRDVLRECLKSVYEQAGDVRFEVVVVDNASADGSAEMVASDFPQVRLIANAENLGFAAACNQGIALAEGRYILLLNPDTVIVDQAIAKTVAFADEHVEAGAVGCRVLNPDGTLTQTCVMYPSLLNITLTLLHLERLFRHHPFFDRERMGAWRYDSVREVPALIGCFMLIRREALDAVGCLDERYFVFCEEIDFCYRLRRSGWSIMFTPDAHIVHIRGESTRKTEDRLHLQRRHSLFLLLSKIRGRGVAWAANLIYLAATFGRLPLWLFRVSAGTAAASEQPLTYRAICALILYHLRGVIWPFWKPGKISSSPVKLVRMEGGGKERTEAREPLVP